MIDRHVEQCCITVKLMKTNKIISRHLNIINDKIFYSFILAVSLYIKYCCFKMKEIK